MTPRPQQYQAGVAAFALVVLLYHLVYFTQRFDYYKSLVNNLVDTESSLDREPTLNPDPSHLFQASRGAVACDVDVCSKMGVDIMSNKGGNAMDAAVTVALCIGSINSFSSGIGGGGFMTIRDGTDGSSRAFNFREMAPGAASKDMFNADPMLAREGGLAVAIPGEVAGLDAAHKKYGKLDWKAVIQPVIDLNRNGFIVEEVLEFALDSAKDMIFANKEEWEPYLRDDSTRLVKAGELVQRHNLANTLELIADLGADIFYDPNGPIAPHFVATAQKHGGIITTEDFTHYYVEESDAMIGEFMGREVITTPNPTSGPALLLGLNILEGYDGSMDFGDSETHLLIETMKWMSSARSELGDHRQRNQSDEIFKRMVSKEFAASVRLNITNETHPWQYYSPSYEPNRPHGTAHFSVIDEHGTAVSLTTTVNLGFGAKIIDPVTGIVLNSEMDDFSTPNTSNYFGLAPSIYNYVFPYYRPLSSTVPTIVVKDGRPEIIIGAAGGSHIYTSVLQAIIRILKYNLPVLDAVAYPRVHHQLLPDVVELEPNTPSWVFTELQDRKHKVEAASAKTSLNAIHVPAPHVIHAVSDYWRKRAEAWGY